MIEIKIPMDPRPWSRPGQSRKGHRYTVPEMRAAKDLVQLYMGMAMKGRRPFNEALNVDMFFFFKRAKNASYACREFHCKKPDRDNLEKLIGDAGNGICWKDDCQIVDGRVAKLYGETPHILIHITPLQSAGY